MIYAKNTYEFQQQLPFAGKIQKECFQYLDVPVMTIGSENMPAIPLNSTLEQTMIPSTEKAKKKIEEILGY